ncbi:adenine phosphoribosyltransferase [Streptomyces sp. NPDC018045]|uniref:adenine phosphoribosyltransferase n=1 Tax=Streptomyces sp. NPDC018045 TaxID=3365037 RepID=UPI0037A5A11D
MEMRPPPRAGHGGIDSFAGGGDQGRLPGGARECLPGGGQGGALPLDKWLAGYIRDVRDHPYPGVLFKDYAALLAEPAAFTALVDALADVCDRRGATRVVGLEARGFLLGAPVAVRCGLGFTAIRKRGKLPGKTLRRVYELEYGTDEFELQCDVLGPKDRVVVVDDVLATGGTALAAASLVAEAGATVVGVAFMLELRALSGRRRLARDLDGVSVDAVINA